MVVADGDEGRPRRRRSFRTLSEGLHVGAAGEEPGPSVVFDVPFRRWVLVGGVEEESDAVVERCGRRRGRVR